MSLPTVEALKAQAGRLVSYFGDKHRFRLKLSSALEAIAAIYHQPDWNTLQALASREAAPAPSTVAAEHYPLDWGPYGVDRGMVPRNDWQRHSLALGGHISLRQAWLQRHLIGQLTRGGTGVFINVFGGWPAAEARGILADQVTFLDLGDLRAPVSVNLLGDLPAEVVAGLLVGALDHQLDGDYWRAVCRQTIEVLAAALASAGQTVTLASIAGALRDYAQDSLNWLTTACAEGSAAQHLAAMLGQDARVAGVSRSLAAQVLKTLEGWQTHPCLAMLFSPNPKAPSLYSMLTGERCVIIEMADQDSNRMMHLQGALLLPVIRHAVSESLMVPHQDRGAHPRVVALGEAPAYITSGVGMIAAQGRSAGWTLLLSAADESAFVPKHREVLANIWNKVYVAGMPEDAIEELVARLRTSPVAVSPGRAQFL